MAKSYYSLEEAISKLGGAEDQVRGLVRAGKLREFRDGGKAVYRIDEVDRLAAGGWPPSPGPAAGTEDTELRELSLAPEDADLVLSPAGAGSLELSGLEGTDLPGLEGTDLPGLEGLDLPDLGGTDLPGFEAGDLPGLEGIDVPGLGGTDLPDLEGGALAGLEGGELPSLEGIDLPDLEGTDLPGIKGVEMPGTKALKPAGVEGVGRKPPRAEGVGRSGLAPAETRAAPAPKIARPEAKGEEPSLDAAGSGAGLSALDASGSGELHLEDMGSGAGEWGLGVPEDSGPGAAEVKLADSGSGEPPLSGSRTGTAEVQLDDSESGSAELQLTGSGTGKLTFEDSGTRMAELRLEDSAAGAGSDVISLEEVDKEAVEGMKKDDTVITNIGISVFDDDDLEIAADPMAKTLLTGGDDHLGLDGSGAGSGLLDLTRESDDTSLGAELLEGIDLGETADAGTQPVEQRGKAAPSEEEALAEVSVETAVAMMPVSVLGVPELASPAFTGLLIAATLALGLAGAMNVAISLDTWPNYLRLLSDHFWFFLLGTMALGGACAGIGVLIAKQASAPRKPKAPKEKKAKPDRKAKKGQKAPPAPEEPAGPRASETLGEVQDAEDIEVLGGIDEPEAPR